MKQSAVIVELVGAWGAGKTTLGRALTRRDESIRAAPCVWTLPMRQLLWGGIQVATTILGLSRSSGRILWKEARQLMRLRAVCHDLRMKRRKGGSAVVIDEGPAVMLGWLRSLAYRSRSGQPARWWRRELRQWARAVDIVVFLDAPDDLLAQRIRGRAQYHPLRNSPDAELSAVLSQYRSTYVDVLDDLERAHCPTMLAFRTDEVSVEHITDQLLEAIARHRGEGKPVVRAIHDSHTSEPAVPRALQRSG